MKRWINAGPTSQTLDQHWTIVSAATSVVCRCLICHWLRINTGSLGCLLINASVQRETPSAPDPHCSPALLFGVHWPWFPKLNCCFSTGWPVWCLTTDRSHTNGSWWPVDQSSFDQWTHLHCKQLSLHLSSDHESWMSIWIFLGVKLMFHQFHLTSLVCAIYKYLFCCFTICTYPFESAGHFNRI